MLAKRFIPCLDVTNGRVVKGINFVNLTDVGDPVEIAKAYYNQGCDELVFLDITATYQERATMIDVIRRTSREIFVPFTVGGGVRSVEDMSLLLNAGADKVSINSSAVTSPELIKQGAEKFGNQCIVVAIDAKKVDESWHVFVTGGRKDTGLDVVEWAKTVESLGAGEILLTSMDKDGTKSGYDIGLYQAVCAAISIPVIASGGAGKKEDMVDVFQETSVTGALAASVFHYGEIDIMQTKKELSELNIPVRI